MCFINNNGFANFVQKNKDMETIQIQLSPNANKSKLIETIEKLQGVLSVTSTTDEDVEDDEFLAEQMTASRKSGKGDKNKLMEFLSNLLLLW
jgi:hypothetical protein